jgi:hypothetical protein
MRADSPGGWWRRLGSLLLERERDADTVESSAE